MYQRWSGPDGEEERIVTIQVPTGALYRARDLLEMKWYGLETMFWVPRAKCLAAMAYLDYFPDSLRPEDLRAMVSKAILAATPGWCGTFGPGVDAVTDLDKHIEGNYDMSQMYLLQVAYRYYDELPEARDHLITKLLAGGCIHRPRLDDHFTSGGVPDDWRRAGFVTPGGIKKEIDETENHILMILTVRYLTNQLLYHRDQQLIYDNRRNGGENRPSCTSLLLTLLRRVLAADFSEYNAKPYLSETRRALLNLCTFAYDHEVRLAARMVLDYVSARIAISSNDLRRLVPFRRWNDEKNSAQLPGGFMNVSLLDWERGADRMAPFFAMQAGNTRVYAIDDPQGNTCVIQNDDGTDMVAEVLSDYRLPPAIHDLFVSDLHRRFFQRLHRTPRPEDVGGMRNCDNMEIYAGSPSYLITAGGAPADYAIDPRFLGIVIGDQDQQRGVAVTTSFMPTVGSVPGMKNEAADLIQFSVFADRPPNGVENYGVAPDFACGHIANLPGWVLGKAVMRPDAPGFIFVDYASSTPGETPGFYLAIYRELNIAILEAFDTWLHPGPSFEDFQKGVIQRNPHFHVTNGVECEYLTWNGNRLHFVVWLGAAPLKYSFFPPLVGARVLRIEYGDIDHQDRIGNAGNDVTRFLNGTVMNSISEAVVEIANPSVGTITLDMGDQWHPRRVSESGEVEQAGSNHEVWVDFAWTGPTEGDVCRPFSTIASAAAVAAKSGVIKIVPGTTRERFSVGGNKRMTLVAPAGNVTMGPRQEVWVDFAWTGPSDGSASNPFNTIAGAFAAVANPGRIQILSGKTRQRRSIGGNKRTTFLAPTGQVTIGAR